MKAKYTVVAVLGIGLAAAAGWWWQHRGPSSPGPSATGKGPDKAPAAGAAPSGAPAAAGRGVGPGGPGGPAPVEVARVQTVRLVDDVQAVGSLRAVQSVVVRPEVSGRVAAIGFRDGQPVRRGQLMVQLDDSVQAAQLLQAQAQAGIAKTNLQRSRELLAQGFVSQSVVDQNAAALEVAQAQVALSQAQVARLRVLAPFDGLAGIRQVNVGDYLKDGADIVGLENLSALYVDFRLPERYTAQLRPGLAVEVTLDSRPGQLLRGLVEALDAQVDANGRSLLVRARIDNTGGQLRAGMFARTRVAFAEREGALVVPEEALVPLGTQQVVYRVVDGPQGVQAVRQPVRIGLRQPGSVEILEGLSAGDRVVTAGQSRLRGETSAVRLVDLDNPGGRSGPGAAGRPASAAASAPASAPASAAGRT